MANKFKKNKINVGTYRVKSSNNYNRLADATTTTTTTNTITTSTATTTFSLCIWYYKLYRYSGASTAEPYNHLYSSALSP